MLTLENTRNDAELFDERELVADLAKLADQHAGSEQELRRAVISRRASTCRKNKITEAAAKRGMPFPFWLPADHNFLVDQQVLSTYQRGSAPI